MACLKCSGEMIAGFIPDAGHNGALAIPRWYPGGLPEKSFWSGLKIDTKQGTLLTASRCTACGFVEPYAKPA